LEGEAVKHVEVTFPGINVRINKLSANVLELQKVIQAQDACRTWEASFLVSE
jgi:hypothetical protein